MVETTKCDHCGADAHFVITKEFDGKLLNFCCKGCLGVYEMLREESLPAPSQNKKSEGNNPAGSTN